MLHRCLKWVWIIQWWGAVFCIFIRFSLLALLLKTSCMTSFLYQLLQGMSQVSLCDGICLFFFVFFLVSDKVCSLHWTFPLGTNSLDLGSNWMFYLDLVILSTSGGVFIVSLFGWCYYRETSFGDEVSGDIFQYFRQPVSVLLWCVCHRQHRPFSPALVVTVHPHLYLAHARQCLPASPSPLAWSSSARRSLSPFPLLLPDFFLPLPLSPSLCALLWATSLHPFCFSPIPSLALSTLPVLFFQF